MGNKMLRSVLAVAFSAGLAFGVVGTSDLTRGDAHHTTTAVWSKAAKPGDFIWDTAPLDSAGANGGAMLTASRVWNSPATETGSA